MANHTGALRIIGLCCALLPLGCFSSAWSDGDYGSEMSYAPDTAASYVDIDDVQSSAAVNPYVTVDHDPFSTFAADVDTASYDIFRQWAAGGTAPPQESVRLEEFVNYFDYDYPAPDIDAEVPFAINLAAAEHPMREGVALLRVGIQAADLPDPADRPRANLVFLIDVSGSMMSENKLPLVQELLMAAVDHLREDDMISIVTYAGSTTVALEPTAVADAAVIQGVIAGLSSGGSTYGSGGINLAYDQADAVFEEGGINQVILCTDGDFNIGPSNTDELVEIIEERRRSGVTLTALGFGQGLNDGMMERVSNAGNGIYSVIYNRDRAEEFLERHLFSSVVHVAKDMKIQVEFHPDHVAAYRLLGYVNRAIADSDFRVDTVDAGEVGAGHRVTALYEVVLAGGVVPEPEGAPALDTGEPVEGEREIGANEFVQVRVRYKDVNASEEDPAREVSDALAADTHIPQFDSAGDDFRWAVAVALFAEHVGGSPYNDSASAQVITDVAQAQADRDAPRAEFASLAAGSL